MQITVTNFRSTFFMFAEGGRIYSLLRKIFNPIIMSARTINGISKFEMLEINKYYQKNLYFCICIRFVKIAFSLIRNQPDKPPMMTAQQGKELARQTTRDDRSATHLIVQGSYEVSLMGKFHANCLIQRVWHTRCRGQRPYLMGNLTTD